MGTRSSGSHGWYRQDVPYRRSEGRCITRNPHSIAYTRATVVIRYYNVYNQHALQYSDTLFARCNLQLPEPVRHPVRAVRLRPSPHPEPNVANLGDSHDRLGEERDLVDDGRLEQFVLCRMSEMHREKVDRHTMTGCIIATSLSDGAGWNVDRFSLPSSPLRDSVDPIDIR